MKKTFLIFVTTSLSVLAAGQTSLITTRLSGPEQITQWRRTGIPTYALAGEFVIAEINADQYAALSRAGFSISMIDDRPWSASYWYGQIPAGCQTDLPADVIFQDRDFFILRSSPAQDLVLMKSGLRLARLNRRTLPERFWRNAHRRIVPLSRLPWDPFIQQLVDQVNTDSIRTAIQRLQDFKTRLMLSDSCHAAQDWIQQKFLSWGYPVVFDSFYLNLGWPGSGWDRNVIATRTGVMLPDRQIIVCGHMDCIVWPDSATARFNAPGADDNGTGAAATLETARIFRNYDWEPTFIFAAWSSEELGLYGSHHYAARADSQDLDIQAVLNLDMIGYLNDSVVDGNIQNHGSFTTWLATLIRQAGLVYAPAVNLYEETWIGGSDDLPFYQHGYAATCNIERWYYQNPNYHKITDLITAIDTILYVNTARAVLAAAAVLGTYPAAVESTVVRDVGDGQRLLVNWRANQETDVVGYRVYWRRQSSADLDSQQTSALVDTITHLLEDTLYFVTVRAVDAAGHVGPLAFEVTGRPGSTPLAPPVLNATPISAGVQLEWPRNQEMDLAGYRIYRRINASAAYESLNTALYRDTVFVDQPLSGANRYYYAVRAFDDNGYASPYSVEAYGRPVTLDQGVLVVDETFNGPDGNFPDDSLQNEFYRNLLNGYRMTELEYSDTLQRPVFADLAPYSSVVWFGDDYTSLLASQAVPVLQQYLSCGGRLWIAGWKPTADLRNLDVYPVDFLQGSFIHYFLRLQRAELTAGSDSFQAALGRAGYPDLPIDPAKVPTSSWLGTMRYIEALTGAVGSEPIYLMDMRNNNSPYEGAVCGTRFLGFSHQVVFFGFPLYFMKPEPARLATEKVMQDFGEKIIKQDDQQSPVSRCQLYPGHPNPFREEINIGYFLPDARRVTIAVYNAAGQLVRTLIDQFQNAGFNSVTWNGMDIHGRAVARGVYFLCLRMENEQITSQLLYIK